MRKFTYKELFIVLLLLSSIAFVIFSQCACVNRIWNDVSLSLMTGTMTYFFTSYIPTYNLDRRRKEFLTNDLKLLVEFINRRIKSMGLSGVLTVKEELKNFLENQEYGDQAVNSGKTYQELLQEIHSKTFEFIELTGPLIIAMNDSDLLEKLKKIRKNNFLKPTNKYLNKSNEVIKNDDIEIGASFGEFLRRLDDLAIELGHERGLITLLKEGKRIRK